MDELTYLGRRRAALRSTKGAPGPLRVSGKVVDASGMLVKVAGIQARIGALVSLTQPQSGERQWGEVVGFAGKTALVMPFGDTSGFSPITQVGLDTSLPAHLDAAQLAGRVLDGLGRPLDGRAMPAASSACRAAMREPLNPLSRTPVDTPFVTGIRSVDALLTCGVGQRVGIIAPAGAGKSTLTGMIARACTADAVVVALIGERGREVREFIERELAGRMSSSIVIAATSDRPPAERIRAADLACTLAQSLRDEGRQVLLIFDSITRYARALRELGLALGEPPTRRGYPPSTFVRLAQVIERAGRVESGGSITGFYTVLAEDADATDPIAEEARSLLDGHLHLSDALANAGHYPAIDILRSKSRVMNKVIGRVQRRQSEQVREWLARYREVELLVQLGEYRHGSDPDIDMALLKKPLIDAFVRQPSEFGSAWDETIAGLDRVAASS